MSTVTQISVATQALDVLGRILDPNKEMKSKVRDSVVAHFVIVSYFIYLLGVIMHSPVL